MNAGDDEVKISALVATFGDRSWSDLALQRAVPSVENQLREGDEIHAGHWDEGVSLAEARNRLAELAVGDWLLYVDADDELEPGYIDAMAQTEARYGGLRNKPDGPRPLIAPLLRRVHGDNLTSAFAAYPNKGRWPQLNECVIGTLVHRDLFEEVGGFRDHTDDGTEIAMYEDWDLWLRCWDAGAVICYSDAVYREHVSTGRNTNAHLSQPVYDAIWGDHIARTA